MSDGAVNCECGGTFLPVGRCELKSVAYDKYIKKTKVWVCTKCKREIS